MLQVLQIISAITKTLRLKWSQKIVSEKMQKKE